MSSYSHWYCLLCAPADERPTEHTYEPLVQRLASEQPARSDRSLAGERTTEQASTTIGRGTITRGCNGSSARTRSGSRVATSTCIPMFSTTRRTLTFRSAWMELRITVATPGSAVTMAPRRREGERIPAVAWLAARPRLAAARLSWRRALPFQATWTLTSASLISADRSQNAVENVDRLCYWLAN